ncbi:hypothetical protein [Dactylosporangium darangshiense]|uniref:hypothetical protein n=1 Tax=Dactylosporangium darangshiense TaxID=579108 RepID=UPI003638C8FC
MVDEPVTGRPGVEDEASGVGVCGGAGEECDGDGLGVAGGLQSPLRCTLALVKFAG